VHKGHRNDTITHPTYKTTEQHALIFFYNDLNLTNFLNVVLPLCVVQVHPPFSIDRFIIARLQEDGIRRDDRAIYAEGDKLTVMRDVTTPERATNL
jgi:hypothetical protein